MQLNEDSSSTEEEKSEEKPLETEYEEIAEVISEDNCLIEEKIREMLTSLLETIEDDEDDKEFVRFLPHTTTDNKFAQIFSIIPHEGCLEPDEYNITYFRFRPQANTEVTATVYCHIVGGANEAVTLTGKCRELSYCIKDQYVDYGKIYFYEVGDNEAVIVNDGEGKFRFEVSEAVLPSGWLSVEPSTDEVAPGETFPLTLKCFPGAVGRFETTFNVEVEYLDPTTITVWGFGVYPQIYFSLPRPELNEMDPYVTYSAIAELGTEIPACACPHDYFADTDRRILEDDDWVVISFEDAFPCTMEIDLSTERVWAKYQLNDANLLNKLASGEKLWPIPNFVVSPYVFDLGCVKINTKTRYNLTYLNYGPGKTVVRTESTVTFNRNGFDSHFVRQIMELNQVSEIHLSFFPLVDKFPELNTKVTEFIFMDVRNGPRIPLQLEALVATPIVEVRQLEVDFGSIRCGDCLRKSINIINK